MSPPQPDSPESDLDTTPSERDGMFSREALNRIFAVSAKHPDRLHSRENSTLEFKESFNFSNLGKYIRSAAGFANAKGGYIVYGVKDRPHTLTGLKDFRFSDLDPETLSHYLNQHFDPEIHWDRHLYEIDGKTFGILYFFPSKNKPVVCKKGTDDGKSLKEGDIYYRYNGRTQTIRYAELKMLIEERRIQEQLLWFKHLKEIARVGISDAAIFDLRHGTVEGEGGTLIIDESLIPQLAFIRDGEFNEVKGKPTLKLIGSLQASGSSILSKEGKPQVVKTQGIRSGDIIQAFLKKTKVPEPLAYVTQICYESSAFLPFYFFLKQGGLSVTDARNHVEKEPSTVQAKSKLLKRMLSDESLRAPRPSENNASGKRKLCIRNCLVGQKVAGDLAKQELTDLLDVILTLDKDEVPIAFLRTLLLAIFHTNFAQQNQNLNQKIRKAICFVDWLHYGPEPVKIEDK